MTSKIQVKRGLKGNLPTLGSGEFGFCTDKKELYIGSDAGNLRVDATDALASENGAPIKAVQYSDGFVTPRHTATLLNEDGDTKLPGVLYNKYRIAEGYRDGFIGSVHTNVNVANEKFDILFPGDFDGWFEIEIGSAYSYGSSIGKLAKRFAMVVTAPTIHKQQTFYTAADSDIANNIAISDLRWDAAKGLYVTIAKRTAGDGNQYNIFIRAVQGYTPIDMARVRLSETYTTDTEEYPRPVVQFPAGVQVGGVDVIEKRDVIFEGAAAATGAYFLFDCGPDRWDYFHYWYEDKKYRYVEVEYCYYNIGTEKMTYNFKTIHPFTLADCNRGYFSISLGACISESWENITYFGAGYVDFNLSNENKAYTYAPYGHSVSWSSNSLVKQTRGSCTVTKIIMYGKR